MKKVVIVVEFEDDELEEFIEDTCHGDLREWVFGELCQNQGMGFLTNLQVVDIEETEALEVEGIGRISLA